MFDCLCFPKNRINHVFGSYLLVYKKPIFSNRVEAWSKKAIHSAKLSVKMAGTNQPLVHLIDLMELLESSSSLDSELEEIVPVYIKKIENYLLVIEKNNKIC